MGRLAAWKLSETVGNCLAHAEMSVGDGLADESEEHLAERDQSTFKERPAHFPLELK